VDGKRIRIYGLHKAHLKSNMDLEENIPKYKQNPPDWCDDCTVQDGPCPDCGCTHNC
jgi:hypothetical protein